MRPTREPAMSKWQGQAIALSARGVCAPQGLKPANLNDQDTARLKGVPFQDSSL